MPDINVEAQGKTFTFPDGTSQQQIGEAVDSFFKGKASSKPSFDYEKGNYIPSEGIGSSGMRSKGTASQQALMTPKAAFEPTPEQRAKLGPLGTGVSQQPLPQGIGYDVARGVLSFMKNEPGATLAKGYYESDPGSYERLMNDKGFMAEAKRTAIGSLEPNQALPLMAGGGILSILPKKAAALGLGAIAANQAKAAYDKLQEGDPGAAAFQLLMGGAAGLGAKKMLQEPVVAPTKYSPAEDMIGRIEGRGPNIPDLTAETPVPKRLTKVQKAEIKKTLAQAQAARPEIQRLQQMNVPEEIGTRGPTTVGPETPLIRPGRTGKGASPTAPTLPLASEFDQSQPVYGAEGPPPLGKPPFKTTYQGTAPAPTPIPDPTISPEPITFQQFVDSLAEKAHQPQGEPSRVSGAQPFQLEPNFRPDDTTMSFQDWLDTFQGKGPLSAKQPFTTNQAGVTAKPGESAIQKALPAGEDISRELTEPPSPTPAPDVPSAPLPHNDLFMEHVQDRLAKGEIDSSQAKRIIEREIARRNSEGQRNTNKTSGVKEPWEMTKDEFSKVARFRGVSDSNTVSYDRYGLKQEIGDSGKHWTNSSVKAGEYSGAGENGRIRVAHSKDFPEDVRDNTFINMENNGRNIPTWAELPTAAEHNPHEFLVRKALSEGKHVPPEVLADYPNLVKGNASPSALGEGQAPPSKGTGLKIKKGNTQSGAFDTSIIKDAAEKAVDVASRIGASQIYGEKGMIRPGEMPEAFQNAANSTRDMFIRRGSFTNEIAPDTFRFTNMLDNAPKIARESVDKISRSLDPMTTAMKDTFQDMVTADKQLAVGAKNPIYSDAQVKNFFSNPAIAAILPKYNAAVQRVYGPIRNAAGYGQTNRVGKYSGVYSPSIPEDQLLGASVGGGAPGTKPSLVLNKMPGESQFTGNAPSYLGSLQGAHEFRLSGAVRASLQRQIVKNGVREGVIQSVPDGYDGTMMVNGRKLEAYKFKLSSLFNGGTDLGRIGVADEPSYIMPKQMFDEIRPVFEKGAKPAVDTGKNRSILSKILSPLTLMKAQLLSTGELGAHAVTLPGIAGQATKITTGSKAVDALVNSIPMAKQIVRVKDMVGLTKFSKVDVADARILMAKAGVLKESPLADASSTLQRIIAEKKGAPIPAQTAGNKIAAGLTQPGGVALYARKGFYNNIGTGIVKSMRAQGATDAQIVDALSNLPNKGGTFTSRTQDFVERLLGPGFYSTGVASLKAGLNSMTPRNVAGGLALYTIVGKMLDEDHKAWYERNLLPGQFVRGKDSRGKQMVWDAATFDRPMRVQRDVPGKMYQESQVDLPNETPAHKKARIAETGLWAGVNQLTRPAASGPTMAIGSYATGMLPYLQKSSDRWGPEMAGHPMAKLGPGKADWWKGLGEALLPGAQVAIGDVGAEYRGNSPEDKNLQWVNRVLKTLGQQQGKAQRPDQVYINALLTEYGNRSGSIKGRAKASLQAEAQARAKASGSE